MKKIPLAVLLVVLSVSVVNGQWNADTLVRNPIGVYNGSWWSNIVHSGAGGFYITWFKSNSFTNRNSIYAQKVDSLGYTNWTLNGIMLAPEILGGWTNSGVENSSLTSDDSSGAIMVWVRSSNPDTIMAQRFDENGNTMFGASGRIVYLASAANYNIDKIITVRDNHGGIVLICEGHVVTFPPSVFAIRMDRNGNLLYSPSPMGVTYNGGLNDAVADGYNGAYITFKEPISNIVYAQHIDSLGNLVWPSPVIISNYLSAGTDSSAGMCYDSTGGCYIACMSAFHDSILLQHVDSSGTLRWPAGMIAGKTTIGSTFLVNPQLVYDGNGGVFVGYRFNDLANGSLRLKHFNANGNSLLNTSDTVVCTYNSYQNIFRMTRDNSGGIIFTWEDYRFNKFCGYSQRYDSNGQRMWSPNGYPIIAAGNLAGFCMAHHTIEFETDKAVVAFTDTRTGANNYKIYMAKLFGNPILTEIDEAESGIFISAFPNPVISIIRIEIPVPTERIEIHNVFGEKIYAQQVSVNVQEVDINFSNFSPGIYFITITGEKGNKVVRKVVKI